LVSDRTKADSAIPQLDEQDEQERGQNEPRDRDDFESHPANRRNVVVDVRVPAKESVTIAKDVCASYQVDEEEECPGDSKGRKSHGIN
jgi:hypothetical protein